MKSLKTKKMLRTTTSRQSSRVLLCEVMMMTTMTTQQRLLRAGEVIPIRSRKITSFSKSVTRTRTRTKHQKSGKPIVYQAKIDGNLTENDKVSWVRRLLENSQGS